MAHGPCVCHLCLSSSVLDDFCPGHRTHGRRGGGGNKSHREEALIPPGTGERAAVTWVVVILYTLLSELERTDSREL